MRISGRPDAAPRSPLGTARVALLAVLLFVASGYLVACAEPSELASFAPTTTVPPDEVGSSETTEAAKVKVPKLTGLSLDEARNKLRERGLEWEVKRKESATADPGTVISQSRKSGRKVSPGTTITLTVAKAPPPPPPPAPNCHPSYDGACLLPSASDYDCAGGSGNGPYYTGFVYVVGPDVFGLDADNDGFGCE